MAFIPHSRELILDSESAEVPNVGVVHTQKVKLTDGTSEATVRNLASNDALNVAVVDGSGNQITNFGGGSGGTEYTVDAAAPAAPVGGTIVAERDDQLAALAEAEGDWTNVRATSKGALWVAIPDTNGDPITSFGGGVQKNEDAAHVSGDTGTVALGVRQDTPANLSDTDGDYEPFQVSAGRMWVSAKVDTALPAGTNNIGDVDVLSLPALPAGTNNIGDVDIASIAAGDNNIGNVDIVTLPSIPAGTNNIGDVDVLTLPSLPAGTNNIGDVDVVSSALPTGASTLAEQQTQTTALGAIQTATQLIDDAIVADDAAFTPATTKVMMAGFEFDDTTPDSVNEGDAGAARMSSRREVYVQIRDAAGNERGLNIDANGALATSTTNATTGDSGGVTVSTSAVLLKASNTSRKSILISNNGTGNLFISRQNTVSNTGANMGILIKPGGVYTDGPFGLYTGDIYGIYDTASGSQNVAVWERT